MSLADVDAFAVPLAQSAGLAELEARWRYELMMDRSNSREFFASARAHATLRRTAAAASEIRGLGAQLEQFAPALNRSSAMPSGSRPSKLIELPATPRASCALSQRCRSAPAARPADAPVSVVTDSPSRQTVATRFHLEFFRARRRRLVVANGDAALAHALVSSVAAPVLRSGRNHTTLSSDSILRNERRSERRVPLGAGR